MTSTTHDDEQPPRIDHDETRRTIEKMIADALPEIAGKLISMAKDGCIPAARYLYDRLLGRCPRVPVPPSIDAAGPNTVQNMAKDRDLLARIFTEPKAVEAAGVLNKPLSIIRC